jgi:broad specificity phosphatase PhoE
MIYLLRHGQTEWNSEGRYQGWLDSPLTQRGREQALAAGRLLARLIGNPGDLAVISSPLGRARTTADLALWEMGLESGRIAEDGRLREVGMGEWEGVLNDDVYSLYAERVAARRANPWSNAPPGGETHADVADRVAAWLAEQSEDRSTLVVTHGVAGRILRGLYLRLDRPGILALPVLGQDEIHVLSDGRSMTHETIDM